MFRTAQTLSFLLIAALAASAEVHEFRMDQDRLWLQVEGEPLSGLLERFAVAGVQVQIDPAVQKTVEGLWQDADIEKTLDQLIAPYDYRLNWRRETGPLGERITLTGIRVFRQGFASEARPLRAARRIEATVDGRSRYLAREILIGFGPGSTMDDLNAFEACASGPGVPAEATCE